VCGHVLDDHVDVDVGPGQSREDLSRDAYLVREVVDCDFDVVESVGDSGDDGLFIFLSSCPMRVPGALVEARAHP